jgi:tetratricopeptide (TPR) repeat protein
LLAVIAEEQKPTTGAADVRAVHPRSPSRTPALVLLLLVVLCFSLGAVLQLRVWRWSGQIGNDSVLKVLFGDGRRIFANQAFVEADVYFHSGYYPSVFDQSQAPKDSRHMTAREGSSEEEEHERKMNFLGPPRDWIERFGRHFLITEHTHLGGGREKEILPWLKFSAELDPNRIDTYTVASYWLRKELGKPSEAEQFLREGLRNNPQSYELLLELGRLYNENYHDLERAHNVWLLALQRWQQTESSKKEPDLRGLEEIAVNLARVEEQQGDLSAAIGHLKLAAKVSPVPGALTQQIQELQRKLGGAAR